MMLHKLFPSAMFSHHIGELRVVHLEQNTPDAENVANTVKELLKDKADLVKYLQLKAEKMRAAGNEQVQNVKIFATRINELTNDPNLRVPEDMASRDYLLSVAEKLGFVPKVDKAAEEAAAKIEGAKNQLKELLAQKVMGPLRELVEKLRRNPKNDEAVQDLRTLLRADLPDDVRIAYDKFEAEQRGGPLNVLAAFGLLARPAPAARPAAAPAATPASGPALRPAGGPPVGPGARMVGVERMDYTARAMEWSRLWFQFAQATDRIFPLVGGGRRMYTNQTTYVFNHDPVIQDLKRRIGCIEVQFIKAGILCGPVLCPSQKNPYLAIDTALRYGQMFANGVPRGVGTVRTVIAERVPSTGPGAVRGRPGLPPQPVETERGSYGRVYRAPASRPAETSEPPRVMPPRAIPSERSAARPANKPSSKPTESNNTNTDQLQKELVAAKQEEAAAREAWIDADRPRSGAVFDRLESAKKKVFTLDGKIQAAQGDKNNPDGQPDRDPTPGTRSRGATRDAAPERPSSPTPSYTNREYWESVKPPVSDSLGRARFNDSNISVTPQNPLYREGADFNDPLPLGRAEVKEPSAVLWVRLPTEYGGYQVSFDSERHTMRPPDGMVKLQDAGIKVVTRFLTDNNQTYEFIFTKPGNFEIKYKDPMLRSMSGITVPGTNIPEPSLKEGPKFNEAVMKNLRAWGKLDAGRPDMLYCMSEDGKTLYARRGNEYYRMDASSYLWYRVAENDLKLPKNTPTAQPIEYKDSPNSKEFMTKVEALSASIVPLEELGSASSLIPRGKSDLLFKVQRQLDLMRILTSSSDPHATFFATLFEKGGKAENPFPKDVTLNDIQKVTVIAMMSKYHANHLAELQKAMEILQKK